MPNKIIRKLSISIFGLGILPQFFDLFCDSTGEFLLNKKNQTIQDHPESSGETRNEKVFYGSHRFELNEEHKSIFEAAAFDFCLPTTS
jgi:hypothetical protein